MPPGTLAEGSDQWEDLDEKLPEKISIWFLSPPEFPDQQLTVTQSPGSQSEMIRTIEHLCSDSSLFTSEKFSPEFGSMATPFLCKYLQHNIVIFKDTNESQCQNMLQISKDTV
ncbi:uncharacterized protein LOC109983449 [Xyrichtys novacula]|uniref:Uncharacterized protein LOC109983449 n=1 Tax=Xyrichtys novacula TaxID=13765 RepID=A0AAV1H1X6_XYRNO|nr:uncharacterized protein LOC109983449 [Xyrichtys novacula]